MQIFPRLRSRVALFVVLSAAVFAAFWLGLVPQRFSPFAAVSLADPPVWFLDFRLSALKHDPVACRSVLRPPVIEAAAIPNQPFKSGCGWDNAVHVASAAGVHTPLDPLTCEMAAAHALWLKYEVQPAALAAFGVPVTAIHNFGTYACRNIVGNRIWKSFRSQHAFANALDIAAFTLKDGRLISVRKDWKGDTRESRFLHDVHAKSCRYFRASLSPDFNQAHNNHMHLDRGPFASCR